MKIKDLKQLGFEEQFVSAEEAGDNAFYYLTYDGEGIELISREYVEMDDEQSVEVFFFDADTTNRPLGQDLIEALVKHSLPSN